MEQFFTKRRTLIILTVLTFLIAWNRGISLLYGMFSLLLATTLIGHLFPRLTLKGLAAWRWHTPAAFEGQELEISVSLSNNARRTKRMIEVVDIIPAATPEQQRPMSFVARIGGRRSRDYAFNITCDMRGEYKVGPLTLRSAFPLGIATQERILSNTISDLLVYPQIFPIASLPLMGGSNMPLRGVEAISEAGGSEDFFGTREYRQGDSPRHIHWPSTARHAQLVVKEFEIRAATEVTVVLDLHRSASVGLGKENTLEYAIKIAASISNYAIQKGHEVQLVGYGSRPKWIPPGRGLTQLAPLLAGLARATASGDTPYPKAINQGARMMRDGGTAILLFLDHENRVPECIYSLALLRAKRIRPLCVFVNRETFLGRADAGTARESTLFRHVIAQGAPAFLVNKDDNLEEIFSMS